MSGSLEITSLLEWLLTGFIISNALLVSVFLIQCAIAKWGGDNGLAA